MEELDFGNNAISKVDAAAFEGLSSVASLALNGNQLTVLPDQVFAPLQNATFLNLDENLLAALPSSLGDMLALSWLSAAKNQLTSLDTVDFSALAALSNVDLGSNRLSYLQPGTFSGNTRLSSLRLYNNSLTSFSADVLPEGVSIRHAVRPAEPEQPGVGRQRGTELGRGRKDLPAGHGPGIDFKKPRGIAPVDTGNDGFGPVVLV